MSWQAEMKIAGEGDCYYTSGLLFATKLETETYAEDLAARWPKAKSWRVTESSDPANYRWIGVADGLVRID